MQEKNPFPGSSWIEGDKYGPGFWSGPIPKKPKPEEPPTPIYQSNWFPLNDNNNDEPT